jgi:hypothetical protein
MLRELKLITYSGSYKYEYIGLLSFYSVKYLQFHTFFNFFCPPLKLRERKKAEHSILSLLQIAF